MLTEKNFIPSCAAAMQDTKDMLDQAMDTIYKETGINEEVIEAIKQDFWLNHNQVFGERDG